MARVFISSGQRPEEERQIVDEIVGVLKNEFDLDSYRAFRIHGINDVTQILDELKKSDYYLFIDFYRETDKVAPYSLFTHQELVLARECGFEQILAYRNERFELNKRLPGGISDFIQTNPQKFKVKIDLIDQIRKDIKDRGWSKTYSRNLIVSGISIEGPIYYGDHTGNSLERVCQAQIRNRRTDAAALQAVCILDEITNNLGEKLPLGDRTPLKWAGLSHAYENTILPSDHSTVDLFAIRADRAGIFLHSRRDTPRSPVVENNGAYKFHYKIFSDGFPILRFVVDVNLRWSAALPLEWHEQSTATLAGL